MTEEHKRHSGPEAFGLAEATVRQNELLPFTLPYQQDALVLARALLGFEEQIDSLRFCSYCATGFIPNPPDVHRDSCPGCARANVLEGELASVIVTMAGQTEDYKRDLDRLDSLEEQFEALRRDNERKEVWIIGARDRLEQLDALRCDNERKSRP